MVFGKTTQVYSVFPLCGKTYLYKHQKAYGIKVLDSDSSQFSWTTDENGNRIRNPEFPGNYVKHIAEAKLSGEYDYIFVSTHKEVRDALSEANINFCVVYPDISLLTEWVGRWHLRDYNGFPIDVLTNNWEEWIDDCSQYPSYDRIVLESNQYLAHVLDIKIDIKQLAWDRYPLYWMMTHGYTFGDMMERLNNYCGTYTNLVDDFDRWVTEEGFDGTIWSSKEEFMENEFKDERYIMALLTPQEYKIYKQQILKDFYKEEY